MLCTTLMLYMDLHWLPDERVPTELKKSIMQARMDKKLTQAQLSQVIYCLTFSFIWVRPTCIHTHVDLLTNILGFWLQLINEKPQIIQEYESGKAIPNQQIISKLERALGVKLRGKK